MTRARERPTPNNMLRHECALGHFARYIGVTVPRKQLITCMCIETVGLITMMKSSRVTGKSARIYLRRKLLTLLQVEFRKRCVTGAPHAYPGKKPTLDPGSCQVFLGSVFGPYLRIICASSAEPNPQIVRRSVIFSERI